MRKSGIIWIYAFLLHDLIKLSAIPHKVPKQKRAALLQLDLRRIATRYIYSIPNSEMNFKCFLPRFGFQTAFPRTILS